MNISKERFINAVGVLANSVYDFHERFGIEKYDFSCGETLPAQIRTRLMLQDEEIWEVEEAMSNYDVDNLIEELVDVLYVALGNVINLDELAPKAIEHVANKNNAKDPANYVRNELGKITKRGI